MDELTQKFSRYLDSLRRNQTTIDEFIGKRQGKRLLLFKDGKLADKARKEGNEFFSQDHHDSAIHHKILQMYNLSVSYAPNGSEELASAYGNRSALLRHLRKYAESIIEIDKALKITKCAQMKVKLLCRKAECLTALGSSGNRSCLEKARFFYARSNKSEKIKKKMEELITQTQSTIDTDKLDKPKENLKKIESCKITAEAESIDTWSCVRIKYNEEYGKHLVAARDFEPGEVIFVEKPYVNYLDFSRVASFCSYCCNYLWIAFPCDYCIWQLFCSQQCKNDAMKEYHDMECSAIVQMEEAFLFRRNTSMPLAIRTLIKAVKEAGSVRQLQRDLKAVDKCEDMWRKGFSPTEKCKDLHIIHIRQFRQVEDSYLQNCMKLCCLALMGLAKYSSLFKENYDLDEIDKFMNDDSAVFAGAFMLKVFLLNKSRNTTLFLDDPYEEDIQGITRDTAKNMISMSEDSICLRSVGFLTIIDCIANAHSFFTYDNKFVTHALIPIQKGTPIAVPAHSIYNLAPKADRQAIYQKVYNRPCNCEACVNDWSEKLTDPLHFGVTVLQEITFARLVKDIKELEKEVDAKANELNFPEPKLLAKAKKNVAKAWEDLYMPSMHTVNAVRTLTHLLLCLHTTGYRMFKRLDPCKKRV